MKKYLIAACCAASLLTPQAAYCEERGNPLAGEEITAEAYVQDAYDAANRGVEVVFPYVPHQVYQIYLQEGFVTDIRLEQNETLKYVGGGDTIRWKIDTSTTGTMANRVTHIFVKPTQRGISTNLIINTDRRTYQLLLVRKSALLRNDYISHFVLLRLINSIFKSSVSFSGTRSSCYKPKHNISPSTMFFVL